MKLCLPAAAVSAMGAFRWNAFPPAWPHAVLCYIYREERVVESGHMHQTDGED